MVIDTCFSRMQLARLQSNYESRSARGMRVWLNRAKKTRNLQIAKYEYEQTVFVLCEEGIKFLKG